MFVSVHQIKQLFLPVLTDWFCIDEPLQSAQPSSWLSLKPLWMPKLSVFCLVTPSSWQCDKGSLAPQRGGSHSALDAGWREARLSSSSWESMDGVMPLPERKREILCFLEGFPGGYPSDKELASQYRRWKRGGFESWVSKIPWRRAWQPTPVFLPEVSHGQRSLADYSPWRRKKTRLRRFSRHTHAWASWNTTIDAGF